MNDEARKLLEEVMEKLPNHLPPPPYCREAELCPYCRARAFLAEPTAAREAVYVAALVRTGKWSPTAGGYLVCMVCCNGVRCECDRGEHIPREDCLNCLGKSGSLFAATTPAAAALLAQGEALVEIADKLAVLRQVAEASGVRYDARVLGELEELARAALAPGEEKE